ncbi:hypothetical protein DID88_003426 [Monilinia fructigena]|uniref:Seipin n=1 Tax=Monilinia fructigena TaxID=38457 RepID=A0A395IUG3_9HELO|nr:hypothetical protein DID88_003426 [Monilinia fructigena]
MDTIIHKPIAIAASKPARKTYLNTILFLTTSLVLFGFAVLAYAGFYWSWVPAVGVERKVWLQFASNQHPHGIVPLDNSLVTRQEYDIQLELHMPRSPLNLRAGNFMVHVNFLGPSYRTPSSIPGVEHLLPLSRITKNEDVLFSSRRPTILTYERCIVGWGILKLFFEDTPRTFPTVRRQMPLVYPPVGIKKEEDEEERILEETVILPLGGDADDEDEEGEGSWQAGRRSDSGLGTSFSEAGIGSLGRVSRRRSRGGPVNGL